MGARFGGPDLPDRSELFAVIFEREQTAMPGSQPSRDNLVKGSYSNCNLNRRCTWTGSPSGASVPAADGIKHFLTSQGEACPLDPDRMHRPHRLPESFAYASGRGVCPLRQSRAARAHPRAGAPVRPFRADPPAAVDIGRETKKVPVDVDRNRRTAFTRQQQGVKGHPPIRRRCFRIVS